MSERNESRNLKRTIGENKIMSRTLSKILLTVVKNRLFFQINNARNDFKQNAEKKVVKYLISALLKVSQKLSFVRRRTKTWITLKAKIGRSELQSSISIYNE